MISSFSIMDEDVIRSVQKDYITAAEHYRLIKSVEGPSLWDKFMAKLHQPKNSEPRSTRKHTTHTLAGV